MSIERDLRRAFKGSGAVTDPYWNSVSALVLTNSTGPTSNKTAVDETGGVTFSIGTSTTSGPAYSYLSPFATSPGSYYSTGLLGASGLKISANTNLNFNGDFTVECWAMIPSGTTLSGFPSPIINGDNAGFFASGPTANRWVARAYGGALAYTFTSTIVSNDGNWRHLALCRSGTSLRFFINGTQIGSTATVSATAVTNYSGSNFMCGVGAGPGAGDNQCPGYMSNVRFSNSARYTANFTPPTSKFTVDANTKFLWLGNGAFWDVSSTKNRITQYPATTVVQNSTTKKWSTLNSIESSGTANINSLTMPATTVFAYPGSFTIECWVYVASSTTLNTTSVIYYSPGIIIYANKSDAVNVFSAVVDTANSDFISTVNSKDSAWHHLALVRNQADANTTYFFVDGIMYGSSPRNTSYSQAVQYIGSNGTAGNQLIGFVDELRITKGVARYTANFTPPAAPFPTS